MPRQQQHSKQHSKRSDDKRERRRQEELEKERQELARTPNAITFTPLTLTSGQAYQHYKVKEVYITGLPFSNAYMVLDGKILQLMHWRMTVAVEPADNTAAEGVIRNYFSVEVEPDRVLKRRYNFQDYRIPVNILIQRRGYGHSNRAPVSTRYSADALPNASFTCKDIAGLLYEKRLNCYRSDEKGNGCLHWLIRLTDEMKKERWLHSDAFRELREYREKQKIGDEFIVANGKGEFF